MITWPKRKAERRMRENRGAEGVGSGEGVSPGERVSPSPVRDGSG